MRKVRVPLGDRTYPILIDSQLITRLGAECRRLGLGHRCAIITDANVAPLFARKAAESLKQAGFNGAVAITGQVTIEGPKSVDDENGLCSEDCCVREVEEEVGLKISCSRLTARGIIEFNFPSKPQWNNWQSMIVPS